MKNGIGMILVCGLGIVSADCGSSSAKNPGAKSDGAVDAGADLAGEVSLLPAPVLDPKGTYGGKTVAEWGAEWQKWIYQYPGPESLAFNTPGAYCEMGQSMANGSGGTDAAPFFLGIWDFGGSGGGTFTQACTVPADRTILFQLFSTVADNIPGCTSGTEQNCLDEVRDLQSATALGLEIDGKSYGSQVADFAPYLVRCPHFSAQIPNTPGNPMVAYYGCKSTDAVLAYDAYQAGYWIMLAPLAPGPHTIHSKAKMAAFPLYEVTYNLVVADTSALAAADGGVLTHAPTVDAAPPPNLCSGPASGPLVDDMSGSNISLAPPSCGNPGNWTVFSAAPQGLSPGSFTVPAGEPASVANCGSLCQSLYSPLPADLPRSGTSGDAAVDSGMPDAGASGMRAMCIAGKTGEMPYSSNGMTLAFAHTGTSANGPTMVSSRSGFTSDPPPALVDASAYSGIEFWLWVSAETAVAMSSGFMVHLIDKNELPGGGVCFPNFFFGPRSCWMGRAGLPSNPAKGPTRAGPLFGADGSALTALASGWQLVRIPWSSFVTRPDFGGGNEDSVDPSNLAFAQFVVTQYNTMDDSGLAFDFCVHGLRFY